jgi:K+-sensing histidine kinase KdpD
VSQHTIIGVQATEPEQFGAIEAEISAIAQRHGLDMIKHLPDSADELTELRQKLQAANDQIEQYKASFGVLASMSHEIRSPLGAILGNTDMMLTHRHEALPPTQDDAEHLKQINQAGNDLLELINDFVDFNRIQIDKLALYLEPFEVASLLEFVTNMELVKQTTIKLDITQDADIGMMYADPVRVQQVLITGLKIASKLAVPEDLIELNITRQSSTGADHVVFHIRCNRNPLRRMDWIFQRGIRWPLMEHLCHLMKGEITRGSDGDLLEIFIRLPADLEKPAG